jgi:CysZ protein
LVIFQKSAAVSAPLAERSCRNKIEHLTKIIMINAFFKALNDVTSPEFRSVLWKSIGLTLAMFIAVLVGVETLLSFLTLVPWPWLHTVIALGTGIGLIAAFFFLMAPVTAMFAGLFLDWIATRVEQRHYPQDRKGTALSTLKALLFGVQFALVALAVNIVVFPLVFFAGFGLILILASNAYLLSREYFEMAASRFMSPAAAGALRKKNFAKIYLAGVIPAGLAMVPIVNLVVPLFATSFFVHIFKAVQRSSV